MNKDSAHFKLDIKKPDIHLALFVCILVALVLAGIVAYQYRLLGKDLSVLEAKNNKLLTQLQASEEENAYLLDVTHNQQATIDSFNRQISSIGQTVGTLEKLSQTDEELLKKYSKVYFLNENYRPAHLVAIDKRHLYNKDDAYIHAQVLLYLEKLLEVARTDGIDLLVASAFRSFETQTFLKS